MSLVWNTLIDVQHEFERQFNLTGTEIQEPGLERFNWYNKVWTSDLYRRAHIDVVDARETKGLWMMHCCVFPHIHNPAPIFGFDVIAGKNKITGCFHDYSAVADKDHPMIHWFSGQVSKLSWRKERKLPDWAQRIFTPSMVAAGNVQDEFELNQIFSMARKNLNYYLDNVGHSNNQIKDCTEEQNYYCDNQRQNPHTPKVMTSLGLDADDVRVFIQDCLFPKIGENQ